MAESEQPQPSIQVPTSPSLRDTGDSSRSYRWKVIVSTSIANALEWFDFIAFGFFAVIMAKLFFRAANRVRGRGSHDRP